MQKKLINRVGFGTASLHHVNGLKSKLNLLNSAYDAGIRYFDTAPLYGHGLAERTLGQFIKNNRSHSNVTVATKFGLVPNTIVTNYPQLLLPYIARDYTAQYLNERVESSLLSLGLDCLDIVLLHEPSLNDLKTIDSLNEAVLKLKQRGLIKQFGISSQIESAQWFKLNSPELVDILQIEIPLNLTALDKDWIINNATATFGHFRLNSEQHSSSNTRLEQVSMKAVEINPRGTILFSSTKSSHIDSFVSAIAAEDKKHLGGVNVN